MKIFILGASGRTGQLVALEALSQGHHVVAYSDKSLTIQHPRLKTMVGRALDTQRLDESLEGCQVVINTLGPRPSSHKALLSVLSPLLVTLMKKHGITRLITLSHATIAEPGDNPLPILTKFVEWPVRVKNKNRILDRVAHCKSIRESGLRFTIVRPMCLVAGPKRGNYQVGHFEAQLLNRITNSDLAEFLVRIAQSGEFVGEAPMISY